MKLSIGYSPCPNDCFIFDALVHGKIDTEGLQFIPVLLDVEALNKKAFSAELDITKLSYFAFFHALSDYALLRSGSALGFNCGPLLISKRIISPDEIAEGKCSIAIPGPWTTANFLLSLAFPSATKKAEMIFSEIEDAVLDGKVDAGLIIHENRFTYESKGLKKIADLGEFWEGLIHSPIPLGGIAMRKNFDSKLANKVEQLISRSVQFAFENPDSSFSYVRSHAQEMSPEVMRQHIKLYVNEFSLDLGVNGVAAVEKMYREARKRNLLNQKGDFLNVFHN